MVIERRKFVVNTIWSFLSQSSTFVIGLITNIILARMLGPFEFGEIGIVMFFITILNALTDGGLGGALIRRKDISNEDYSTAFIFNFAVSIFFFLSLVASSGLIASYYNNGNLQALVCVSGIIILIYSFNVVQSARIYREMRFKVNMYINLSSVIVSSATGICLAIKGYGVWSVVIMNIVQVFMRTILLWIVAGGIGKLTFNNKSFKSLYRYGIFVTLVTFFNNAFDNIYQLLLGKYFSIKEVGYYYQAKRVQGVPFFILNSLTLGVIFSHLSNFQEDRKLFQSEYLKILSIFSIAIAAVASLIFLLAKDVVQIVLGNVWLESVVYMKLLTIASFFLLLKVYSQNVCKVFNRTEKIFMWELIAILMQIVTIVVGIAIKSIFITISGAIVSNLIAYLINAVYSWRLLGLNSDGEIMLIGKITFASVVAALISSSIGSFHIGIIWHMLSMLVAFVLTYLILLKTLRVLDVKGVFNLYKSLR
jgi:teichuronic acid exporter